MATIHASGYQEYAKDGPDGVNVISHHAHAAGASAGDIIRLCRFRAGTQVPDLSLFVDTDVASMTASVGYEVVRSGESDAEAFVVAGSDASAAGRVRANAATVPGVFSEDTYLTVSVAGADLPNGTRLVAAPTVQTVGI